MGVATPHALDERDVFWGRVIRRPIDVPLKAKYSFQIHFCEHVLKVVEIESLDSSWIEGPKTCRQ